MEQGLAFIGGILFVGFLYFLYTRIQKSRNRPKSTGTGGGGRPRPDIKQL